MRILITGAAGSGTSSRARHGMPTQSSYSAILKFAQERGALKSHTKGSLSPLLWPLMEIKYLCRMRTVEVVALTDAHASEQGLYIARRKRSNDNIVKWSPRLRAAWDAAIAVRAEILARPSNAGRPFPPEPERRYIFLNETCAPMSVSGLNSIWGYLMRSAIEAEVIKSSQRFTLHGLKHRGVTDTKGSRRRKQRASGHQTEEMVALLPGQGGIQVKSVMKLLELRVIAGLGGIGSGVPLLFLRGMDDPMPSLATLSGHSALVIFIAIIITWMLLFRWLRTRRSSDGWMYSIYGGVLGATPGVFYSVANFFAAQPAPLLAMTAAGLVAGALGGLGIQRWDDGLPTSRPTTP